MTCKASSLCPFNPDESGYCTKHRAIYVGKKAKEKKSLNKVSLKMAGIKAELKKLYPIFLKKHPVCQMNTPVCTKKSTCIHHTKGRGKNEILNEGTWLASCENCNGWVESHDSEARQMGLKVSRLIP